MHLNEISPFLFYSLGAPQSCQPTYSGGVMAARNGVPLPFLNISTAMVAFATACTVFLGFYGGFWGLKNCFYLQIGYRLTYCQTCNVLSVMLRSTWVPRLFKRCPRWRSHSCKSTKFVSQLPAIYFSTYRSSLVAGETTRCDRIARELNKLQDEFDTDLHRSCSLPRSYSNR